MNRFYIENLTELENGTGAAKGDWVRMPLSAQALEEICADISNDGEDEIGITDYEVEFEAWEIPEDEDLERLNEICDDLENYYTKDQKIGIQAWLMNDHEIEDALGYCDDCEIFSADDQDDFTRQFLISEGNGIPADYVDYVDWDGIFELEISRRYDVVEVCYGTWVVLY